jgi:hypothetical protein
VTGVQTCALPIWEKPVSLIPVIIITMIFGGIVGHFTNKYSSIIQV